MLRLKMIITSAVGVVYYTAASPVQCYGRNLRYSIGVKSSHVHNVP